MTREEAVSEAFDAICDSMANQNYEQASMIVGYLLMMPEFMTDSQISQLEITLSRLKHLARNPHVK